MVKVSDSLYEIERKREKSDLIFLFVAMLVTGLLTFILALNHFVFMGVRVDGASMNPTLSHGDVLLVNKVARPKEGDVIIVSGTQKAWIIKRVIATEGDKVTFNEDGFVYINGVKYVDEFGVAETHKIPVLPFTEKVLKKGEIFYLGDNRGNSSDSRVYGACEDSQVVGVVCDWSIENKVLNKIFFWI